MHIKERKFYLKQKANYKTVKPHNKRLVEDCCSKKVGQAQLAANQCKLQAVNIKELQKKLRQL